MRLSDIVRPIAGDILDTTVLRLMEHRARLNETDRATFNLRDDGTVSVELALAPEKAAAVVKAIAAIYDIGDPPADDAMSALIAMRAALRSMPGIDPFSHGQLAEADSLAEAVIAKAEGRAND